MENFKRIVNSVKYCKEFELEEDWICSLDLVIRRFLVILIGVL